MAAIQSTDTDTKQQGGMEVQRAAVERASANIFNTEHGDPGPIGFNKL